MSAVPLPKSTHASSVLTCEECGAEVQVLGLDGPDVAETVEQWNREHARCGSDPTSVAWQDLVQRSEAQLYVDPDDDLTKLSPIPRPSWAPVERDSIRKAVWASAYRSESVAIPLAHNLFSEHRDGSTLPSRFEVAAKRSGLGDDLVGITLCKIIDGEWTWHGTNMTLDEARRLAEVITAACDLAVTP
ncbi:hypothetical protein O4159_08810 [Gordonia terrae]|uniref:hypothetical protein n=1 Tax=Gordonia hongkongensis TaxID=1701090 RepID=UPI0022B4C4F5|nr:hypothetical protein [Gordonia terrae]